MCHSLQCITNIEQYCVFVEKLALEIPTQRLQNKDHAKRKNDTSYIADFMSLRQFYAKNC